ncbi:YdeI/OmpD-associated family protein [Dysgonomonas capnocytophagoides]|uniref:YdeI/OmpD-associated family protein n=1 Tax=Dysgonomonas capnocytophagoides TaxID=45254 RepID=UPI00041DD03F|nr:YdeI/OmpD-associated family protein [Dysgonomonas capnocytophagoides]
MNSEIIKKFNIGKFDAKVILNKPVDITDFDGVSFGTTLRKGKYDMIFAFIFSLDEFAALLRKAIDNDLLNPYGMLYFAYPKKGNKQYEQFIGRDDILPAVDMDNDGYVYDSLIKFNKMAAFSDVFTVIGLKLDEKRKKSNQPSQCVADYVDRIPDVRKYFETNKDVLALFDQLTPGYQRGWVRYVYSTKSEATTEKRFAEMTSILKQGYKSIDLFRQNKKRNI